MGTRKVNYKMRDAAFSRQRYWGEPFPVKWIDGVAYPLNESELPLKLPHVDSYKPGPEGEGPLANIPEWTSRELETNTMPGYAGSSWYFLRFMDPQNDKAFCDRNVSDYWNQVDLYIGGTEHAVGHLLYSRMWTKALHDLGYIGYDEPYRKLVNQGMIQGSSRFIYRLKFSMISDDIPTMITNVFASQGICEKIKSEQTIEPYLRDFLKKEGIKGKVKIHPDIEGSIDKLHVDVNIVDGIELDIQKFRKWRNGEYSTAIMICEDGLVDTPNTHHPGSKYLCGVEVEKMSKSKFNTVNPDELVEKYGADTFRMYEMFLGPVEMSKPWDTKGIEGVHRFLKKLWRLYFDELKGKVWTTDKATDAELKVLHRTIRKIEEDTERFSFNTGVSAFMIAVNDLTDLKCHKKEVLEQLLVLLTPYAPHITEELWHQLGHADSILDAHFPAFDSKYLTETSKEYPISVNGKLRTTMNLALDAAQPDIEKLVLQNEVIQKWLEGKVPKKIIYVKGKMVNVVI